MKITRYIVLAGIALVLCVVAIAGVCLFGPYAGKMIAILATGLGIMGTTSAIAGYTGKVYYSTDNSTFVEVGEVKDFDYDITNGMLDATSKASGGFKENIPGIQEWKATAKALHIKADAAQTSIRAALASKAKGYWRFDPDGTGTGKIRFAGGAYLKSGKFTAPLSELNMIDLEWEGTGQLVESTQ